MIETMMNFSLFCMYIQNSQDFYGLLFKMVVKVGLEWDFVQKLLKIFKIMGYAKGSSLRSMFIHESLKENPLRFPNE